MVVITLMGGLGNQMFQYAAAKSLAISLGKKLYLDTSFYKVHTQRKYQLGLFTNITDRQIVLDSTVDNKLLWVKSLIEQLQGNGKEVTKKKYIELPDHFNVYKDLETLKDDIIYLRGYFQSYRYFKKHNDKILNLFSSNLPSSHLELCAKIEQCESVAVHFRRGDYITNPNASKFYAQCSFDYYRRSIAHLQKQISQKLTFFIFSDDIQWVKTHFPVQADWDITFVEATVNEKPIVDMKLMSLCKHHITANSTYSWFGAWLSSNPKKMVCTPKKWFNEYSNGDLIPNNWHCL